MIDLAALGKILVVVLVVGVGITALFGQGIVSLGRLAAARRAGRDPAAARDAATVILAAVVCVGALVAGFVAMTRK